MEHNGRQRIRLASGGIGRWKKRLYGILAAVPG
jgi:hypothetical protein